MTKAFEIHNFLEKKSAKVNGLLNNNNNTFFVIGEILNDDLELCTLDPYT